MELIRDQDIRDITGSSRWSWDYLPSVGASGGIVVLWNSVWIDVININKGIFSISLNCISKDDQFSWLLTGVYGPNGGPRRRTFWNELDNICVNNQLPWVLGGDFNVIKCSNDKLGGSRITTSMKKFNDFINLHELIDLPLKGALYTWFNEQDLTPVKCRLGQIFD